MGEMKPTPGPWTVEIDEDGEWANRWPIITSPERPIIGTEGFYSFDPAQDMANANLCAEAGTVFHSTGLSPVQLVEQRDELMAALMAYEAARQGLFSQTLSNGVFDAWGRCHDCTALNKAHLQARAALAKCEGVGNG